MVNPLPPGKGAWLVAALACLAPAVGCGGGDAGAIERAAIVATLNQAYIDPKPGDCERLHTTKYLTQIEDIHPAEAREECEEDAEGAVEFAESLSVHRVAIDGDEAVASFTTTGGVADGSRMRVELVDSDGWKLDRLADLELNRELFSASTRRYAIKGGLTPADADCLVEWTQSIPTARIEHMALKPDGNPFGGGFAECVGEETIENYEAGLREEALKSSPPEFANCLADRFGEALRSEGGRAALADPAKMEALGRDVSASCQEAYQEGGLAAQDSS